MSAAPAVVARLRIRSEDGDRAGARRVTAAVRSARLHPAGLPVGAVLAVRAVQVTAEHPGAPGPTPALRLQRDLDGHVTAALKRAARPRGCAVDPRADAVLFDDEAHLLACALHLRLHGLGRAWWAAHLPGGTDAPEALLGHEVRWVPAIIDRLAAEGDGPALAGVVPPPTASGLLGPVAVSAGLPAAVVVSSLDGLGAAPTPPPPAWRADLLRAAGLPVGASGPVADLVVLSLAVIRAPAAVRDAASRAARDAPPGDVAATTTGVPRAAGPAVMDGSAPDQDRGQPDDAAQPHDAGLAEAAASAPTTARSLPRRPPGVPHGPATSAPDHVTPARSPAVARDGRPPEAPRQGPEPGPDRASAPRPAQPDHAAASDLALAGVPTGLAGFVYLIALLADPARTTGTTDGPAPGWGAVEALLRALLDDDAFTADPLWAVLAMLDGRRADDPVDPAPPEVAAPVAAAFADLLGRHGGTDAPTPADVLRTSGRVTATTTHVDVVIALDRISIPVRLAGLDRTPGWVPWLSRVVTLTFREHP